MLDLKVGDEMTNDDTKSYYADIAKLPLISGMTLRDWFAGQALAWAGHHNWMSADPNDLAKRAYQMADAMIAAREGGDK